MPVKVKLLEDELRERNAQLETTVRQAVANNDALHERIKSLVAALELLWAEVVASGNSDAKNNGWPKACAAVRKALT